MRAFYAEPNAIKRDEIGARSTNEPESSILSSLFCANSTGSGFMKDIQAHLDKIRSDAAECLLLGSLATDGKREVFTKMAEHLNALAFELEKTITANDQDVAGIAHREEAVVTEIEHPKQGARSHRMLPWLLIIALGGIAGALFWVNNPAQKYLGLPLFAKYEPSSAPQDNSKQAIATLLSSEQAERKLLSEQVTALAGRLDDLERALNNLQKARAETSEPLSTGAVSAEEKPPPAEAKPPAPVEKPVSTVENRASTPENPTSLKQSDAVGPPGCTQFRSFDPKSGTYTTLDGRRRQCR
jgi:BA14K-like protein